MAAKALPSLPRDAYTVGWICAIPSELEAARNMLDVHHGALQSQPLEDGNNYTLGSLNGHNIAILCLAEYGVVAAATAAKAMQFTFPQLRFGLMVGVGGGIPSAEHDIRLGDIVVSLPTGQHGGVIQYDLGRVEADHFERVGSLNKPPTVLRTALSTLRSFGDISKEISTTVDQIRETDEDLKDKWTYPGITKDILFKAEFSHIDKNPTCNECSIVPLSIVSRGSRPTTYPRIHYGNIGSGNSVMKNAKLRDLLSERDNIICFEMESAGLMDSFPCLAIRGICDYADSHKNWQWQPYAAAVAAAFARKLLSVISPLDVARLDSIKGAPESASLQSSAPSDLKSKGSGSGPINHFYGNVNSGKSYQGNSFQSNGGTMNF